MKKENSYRYDSYPGCVFPPVSSPAFHVHWLVIYITTSSINRINFIRHTTKLFLKGLLWGQWFSLYLLHKQINFLEYTVDPIHLKHHYCQYESMKLIIFTILVIYWVAYFPLLLVLRVQDFSSSPRMLNIHIFYAQERKKQKLFEMIEGDSS